MIKTATNTGQRMSALAFLRTNSGKVFPCYAFSLSIYIKSNSNTLPSDLSKRQQFIKSLYKANCKQLIHASHEKNLACNRFGVTYAFYLNIISAKNAKGRIQWPNVTLASKIRRRTFCFCTKWCVITDVPLWANKKDTLCPRTEQKKGDVTQSEQGWMKALLLLAFQKSDFECGAFRGTCDTGFHLNGRHKTHLCSLPPKTIIKVEIKK